MESLNNRAVPILASVLVYIGLIPAFFGGIGIGNLKCYNSVVNTCYTT